MGVIKKLLEGEIDRKLYKEFSTVVDYRDYLVHGKRWREPLKVEYSSAAETLDEVLKVIKNEH